MNTFLSLVLFWGVSKAHALPPNFVNLVCPNYADSPLRRVLQVRARLDHLVHAADDYSRCQDLERSHQPEQYALCESLRLKFVHDRIYTWERVEKLKIILSAIKLQAMKLLEEKYPDASVNTYAQKIQSRIRSAFVSIDFPQSHQRQLDILNLNAMTFPNNEIVVGGLLLLVDVNPLALYQVLAHEMGHVVGPTYAFRELFNDHRTPLFPAFDSSYPFSQGLMCISEKVRKPDYGCFETVAAELSQNGMFRDIGTAVLETSNRLKENPYVSLILSNVAGVSCQAGQSEESFADFFGAEILTRALRTQFGSLLELSAQQSIVQEHMAFFCGQVLVEEVSPQVSDSRYPSMTDRINSVLFSNSYLQETFESKVPENQCAL